MMTALKRSVIAALIAASPSVAFAQGRTPHTDSAAVGGEIGVFRPTDDALDSGLSLDGSYEYYLSARDSVRFGVGWMKPGYKGDDDEHLRYIRIGGDLIHNWEGGEVHPFVGAGLGVYIMQPRRSGDSLTDSESKIGGVLLGGAEFFTSNSVSVKGEISYHLISNVDSFGPENPDGLKLTIGLKKYF
jgi:hypothetical protein